MADYSIYTLSNGMRFVHSRIGGKVSFSGVVIGVGSRDEPSNLQGLAHFVEHTIFKGTKTRKSWHISNRMESIGGELNAYTSKEETVIFANSPAGYESRAFELLSDLIRNSTFPENELNREREVIIEEINSYLDNPGELVFDYFEDRIYKGSALGHNILGNPDSVKKISADDCRKYVAGKYTAGNMVLYSADSLSHIKAKEIAEKYFSSVSNNNIDLQRPAPAKYVPFKETIDRGGHQAHTIIGTRVFGREDPRRFALFLLNNYLGGPCMNSRLNQELRDKKGYVYTVDSMVSLLSDCGAFMIYLGCDIENVEKCRRIIFRELDRIANTNYSEAFFKRIKRQYAGQLIVSSDNNENVSMSLGKSMLYFDEIKDIDFTTKMIEAVSPEDFREAARLINPSSMSMLTLC